MHLFLCWRDMTDRIGMLGHIVETILWGDSRARHTFLIACTNEQPLVLIEIDIGDPAKGINKSMKLNIVEIDEVPDTITKIELIGETSSPTALEHLIRSAKEYVKEHPNYNAAINNCRTFVEYLIDQIPDFRDSIPRKNGSILEYYHSRAKHEHPGALIKGKQLLKDVRDLYRYKRKYKYAGKLVVNVELPKEDNYNNLQSVEKRHDPKRRLSY